MFTNSISKIFIVLAVLAVALVTISFVNRSAHVFTADRSYDGVEQARAQRSHVSSILAVYDQLEALRAQRSVSPLAADSSYDSVEQVRIGRWLNADHSYDEIEALRLLR